MKNKVFKTLDEQIDILQSKGMIINDIDKTKGILLKENYFFVNGYRHLFMKDGKDKNFIEGTTFEELYSTFVFDRNIRNIFFKHILIVENNVKSLISYQMSKKYGFKEKDYLNVKNFTEDTIKSRQVHDVLDKVRRQIRVNGRKHTATIHYITNYGYIPLWILVKVLSFGLMTELYNILKVSDQIEIASIYNLDSNIFSNYLTILSNYRNLCAHEDMLYDYKTKISIYDTIYHQKLDIPKEDDEYIYGKNDLFSLVIILKELLSDNQFRDLMSEISYEIDILFGKISVIPFDKVLHQIGFPSNWRDILKIN